VPRRDRRLDAHASRVGRLVRPATVAADFTRYRDDPVGFMRDVLGLESATRRSDGERYQETILAAVATEPRVAVVSGHGVGKTTMLAALALWWVLSRPFSRVALVAPQFSRQVRGVVFAEVAKLARRARVPLPVEVLADRVRVVGHGPEWGVIGIPATEPDRIEGLHAEGGLLLLMDETKGIRQEVFDALQGALTGGADSRLVVASTPGGCAGPFYRAVTDPHGRWRVVHVASPDSSLVAPEWIADRAADWGPDSPLYRARVLGEFVDAGEGQLFPLALLEASAERRLVAEGTLVLGVDVARSLAGDLNCVAVARGGQLLRLATWRSPDLMTTVARVQAEVLACGERPARIVVDEGGPGGGVVDRLRQLGHPVEAFAFGGAATDPTRFRNRRAEAFFSLRERLERGDAALLDDDDLLADLAATSYRFDQAGRVLLDPKDEVRRRLGRSPDRADAVALALGRGGRPLPPMRRATVHVAHGAILVKRSGRMGHDQQYPSPHAA
jgi:phage terminase large subunit